MFQILSQTLPKKDRRRSSEGVIEDGDKEDDDKENVDYYIN